MFQVEKHVGAEVTPHLPHEFSPLILSLIIPICYIRGLLLHLEIEWIINF